MTRPRLEPDDRWKKVGALIIADRKAKGLSQAELARQIGLQTSTSMWRYESGQTSIPIPRLEQIAQVLGQLPSRYMPAAQKGERPTLTTEESRELYSKLARAAMDAALVGTAEAIENFNGLVAELHDRTGR